ncbi:MAG TPA: hypothetical protein VGL57_13685 [Solirubrobacteraceae bacterium]
MRDRIALGTLRGRAWWRLARRGSAGAASCEIHVPISPTPPFVTKIQIALTLAILRSGSRGGSCRCASTRSMTCDFWHQAGLEEARIVHYLTDERVLAEV